MPPSIWEQTPPTAQEMLLRQAVELAHLRVEVAQLQATVDELARRLERISRNSSPPAAADPPPARSQRARHEPRWPSARRAARPCGVGAGLGPGRRGGCRYAAEACAVRALSARVAGRGSGSRAVSGGGDLVSAAGHLGVSGAAFGLPGLWSRDARGMALGHPAGWFRPTSAGDHGAVHGGVPPVQTHHPARPGGLVRRLDGVGDGGQSGASDGPGGRRTGGRGAGLCPGPAPAYLDETGWREGR